MKSLLLFFAAPLYLLAIAYGADYFPLAVGNEWNFAITNSGFTGTAKMIIKQKVINGADTLFRATSTVAVEGMNDSSDAFVMSLDNDIFMIGSMDQAKPYDKGFEHHPTAGQTWTGASGRTCRIISYGSITVGAGTFTNCFALVVDGDTSEVYAPDVGLVANLSQGDIVLALASYRVSNAAPVVFPGRQTDKMPLLSKTAHYHNQLPLITMQGRRIDNAGNGRPGRQLSPGAYFLVDQNTRRYGKPGTTGRFMVCR